MGFRMLCQIRGNSAMVHPLADEAYRKYGRNAEEGSNVGVFETPPEDGFVVKSLVH